MITWLSRLGDITLPLHLVFEQGKEPSQLQTQDLEVGVVLLLLLRIRTAEMTSGVHSETPQRDSSSRYTRVDVQHLLAGKKSHASPRFTAPSFHFAREKTAR